MNVLIVSQDTTTIAAVSRWLENAGHNVEVVDDYDAAQRKLAEPTFDCILTEWLLPGVDGVELTRRVRAGTVGAMIVPVIVLSELTQPEARAHARRAGAEGYVVKPATPTAILSAVSGVRKMSGTTRAAAVGEILRRRLMQHPVWTSFELYATEWLSELTGMLFDRAPEGRSRPDELGVALSVGMFDPSTRAEVHFAVRFPKSSGALIAAAMIGACTPDREILDHIVGELCSGLLERSRTLLRSVGFQFIVPGPSSARPMFLPRDCMATRSVTVQTRDVAVDVSLGLRASRPAFVKADELAENMLVVEDVKTVRGALLVPAGTRLTSMAAARLRTHLENREICVSAETA